MDTDSVLLTPEQEKEAFYLRWDEFRNIVEISYSTPEDDAQITVYDVAHTPRPPISGLCCPMQTGERGHEFWTNYTPRKREAIRLGFMRGLCKMIGMVPPTSLADWRHLRGEVSRPMIFERRFNPITQLAHRTENYAQGRTKIEALLKTIYAAACCTPFHPNFEHAFFEQLAREPLHNVTSFLGSFSTRYGLATPNGFDYLSELITDAEQTAGLLRPALVERAQTWLRLESVLPQSEHPPAAITQPLDTPALASSPRPEQTPAASPLPTWDEFLPHFRRAVRRIDKDEFTEDDCKHLNQLGQQLVKELADSLKKRPKATKTQLVETLRECLNEMPHAETVLRRKLTSLESTPALYDAHYPLIREAIAAAEDTLGGLIELLGNHYFDTLAGVIQTNKGPLAMRELMLKYLPSGHRLNVREQAAAPSAPRPEQAPPTDTGDGPATLVKGEKIRFCNGFSAENADSVAREIELIDKNNNINPILTLKKGRLCGFYKQLKTEKKVDGSLEVLRDYFAKRYKMLPIPGKPDPGTNIALDTAKETETALKRLFSK